MLIDCPGCAQSYHVSGTDLGDRGRTLVCPRCGARWHQQTLGRDLAIAAVSARPTPRLDEAPATPTRFRFPWSTLAASAAVAACLGFVALVVERDGVVRAMPRFAALYADAGMPVNVVGLAFSSVAPERLASNDMTVRGAIRNVASHKVHVPRLAFEVRDAAGTTLVAWSETVTAKTLKAGAELAFASTPHRLPTDSRTVLVHFE